MLRSKILHLSLVLPVLASSCGNKSSDSTDNSSTTDSTTLTTSPEASTSAASSTLTTTTAALNSGDSTSNSSAASLMGGLSLDGPSIARTRTCASTVPAVTPATATVTLTFSGSETNIGTKVTTAETASGTQTHVWSNPANAILCTANALYAKIAWNSPIAVGTASGVNGLQLVVTANRTQTTVSSSVSKAGVARSRSVVTNTTGTHTVNWSALTSATTVTPAPATAVPATTTITTVKTVASNIVKTEKLTKFDGSTTVLDSTHATLATAPLNITTARTSAGVPLMHTINSGTMTMTKTGAFYLTNAFLNVAFDLTSSDPCIPTGGTMTQSIYKSNAAADTATALKVLTYTFLNNTISVASTLATDDTGVLADQATANMNHKCDLKAGE